MEGPEGKLGLNTSFSFRKRRNYCGMSLKEAHTESAGADGIAGGMMIGGGQAT